MVFYDRNPSIFRKGKIWISQWQPCILEQLEQYKGKEDIVTSVCVLGLMSGSWTDVNWGISDACKPEMNVLSPLHINYPFTPTMYIVLTCSNKGKIDMSHWEGKHFSTTGACREEILNANNKLTFGQKVKEAFSEFQYWPVIVVFQSYSEADKFKHIVNIAMPFWEKASCLHRCYASPLLLVTIAIEDGRWMVTGMGRGL